MLISIYAVCLFVLTFIVGTIALLVFAYERKHDYGFIPFRKSKVLFTIFLTLLGISVVVILAYIKMGEPGSL